MKKIIAIIVLMLITSIGVYAEEPVDRSAEVLIYEVIPSSFLWEIPAEVNLENEETQFQISVKQAHLSPNESVKITVSPVSSRLQDDSGHSLTTFVVKDGQQDVVADEPVLTVASDDGTQSSAYIKTLSIKRGNELKPFQYAGTYKATLTFEASTVSSGTE